MNKINLLVESILAAGVVALFVLFFTVNPWAKKAGEAVEAQGDLLPIAIVNTDSILLHYTLAVESSEKLQTLTMIGRTSLPEASKYWSRKLFIHAPLRLVERGK